MWEIRGHGRSDRGDESRPSRPGLVGAGRLAVGWRESAVRPEVARDTDDNAAPPSTATTIPCRAANTAPSSSRPRRSCARTGRCSTACATGAAGRARIGAAATCGGLAAFRPLAQAEGWGLGNSVCTRRPSGRAEGARDCARALRGATGGPGVVSGQPDEGPDARRDGAKRTRRRCHLQAERTSTHFAGLRRFTVSGRVRNHVANWRPRRQVAPRVDHPRLLTPAR